MQTEKEINNKVKDTKGTIEKFKPVFDYLNSRLDLNFEIAEITEYGPHNSLVFTTDSIQTAVKGIFRNIIADTTLRIDVWEIQEEDTTDIYRISISLRYTHPGGGSNGSNIPINLMYNARNKKVKEVSY